MLIRLSPKAKRISRILLWIAAGVFALLAIASTVVYFNRDKIRDIFVNEVNKSLNAKVGVEKIDVGFLSSFPLVSVRFFGVAISEAYPDTTLNTDTLLKVENIDLEFGFLDLLKGNYTVRKVEVENGELNMRILPSGKCNYVFWKKDVEKKSDKFSFNIKDIRLKNILWVYRNDISKLCFGANIVSAKAKGALSLERGNLSLSSEVLLQHLAFDKVQMRTNVPLSFAVDLSNEQNAKRLTVNSGKLRVGRMRFDANGTVDYSKGCVLNGEIKGRNLKLEELMAMFSKQGEPLFKGFKAKGGLEFEMNLSGELSDRSVPAIRASFALKDASLSKKKTDVSLKNLNLNGSFSNGSERNSSTSFVRVDNFSTEFSYGFAKGRFCLTDFSNPQIDANLTAKTRLENLKDLIPNNDFELLKGSLELALALKGVLKNPSMSGKASIEDLEIKHKRLQGQIVSGASCEIKFDKDNISISNLQGRLNSRPFSLSADCKLSGKAKGTCRLAAYNFGKTTIGDIDAAFDFADNVIRFDKLAFKAFSGSIHSTDCRILLQKDCTLLNGSADLKDIDLKQAFSAADNSGQKLISDKNIGGKLTAKARFNLYFDKDFRLKLDRSYLNTDYTISKGELNGVEMLKKLSRFVEEEALNNVRFEAITSSLQISDGAISLSPIKIKSNAIDFDLVGRHYLNGKIDYSASIKLSQLRSKKHKARMQKQQKQFGTVEQDENERLTLFVKIGGTVDKPIFSYDVKANMQQAKEKVQADRKEVIRSIDKDFNLRRKEAAEDKARWAKQEKGEFIIEWEQDPTPDTAKTKPHSNDADFIIEWE